MIRVKNEPGRIRTQIRRANNSTTTTLVGFTGMRVSFLYKGRFGDNCFQWPCFRVSWKSVVLKVHKHTASDFKIIVYHRNLAAYPGTTGLGLVQMRWQQTHSGASHVCMCIEITLDAEASTNSKQLQGSVNKPELSGVYPLNITGTSNTSTYGRGQSLWA
jgi:hypothetical protein